MNLMIGDFFNSKPWLAHVFLFHASHTLLYVSKCKGRNWQGNTRVFKLKLSIPNN
jgi:hypothetical protein